MASVYIQLPAISISTASLATSANQTLQITQETAINTNLGADITTPTAMPAGGSGVRGWLSAIWTKLNGSLAVTGTFWQATQPVSGTFWQATQPVSGTVTVNAGTDLNTSALATSANQSTSLTQIGIVTETAPATDTASSGLNGRLQRIAQRITSLIAQIPASLGQTTKSASMSVTIASDQTQALTSAQSLTLDGTTAQTFTAPANAKWVKIMASSDNTVDLKVAFGGTTATSTVGVELQPGRAEDFVGVSSVSIICKSAITSHGVFLVWSV